MAGISTTQIVTIPGAIATAGRVTGRVTGPQARAGTRASGLVAVLAIVAGSALAGLACTPARGPNAMDVAFATTMVPHHEMGITLDELAVAGAADVRVRRLAFEMNSYQGPELDQLRKWARTWGGAMSGRPEKTTGPMTDPMTGPMGMPGPGDLDRLRAATGPAFDTRFLTLMIAHHDGAVSMAEHEQAAGSERRAVAMAGRIAVVQERQLAALRALLAELGAG